MKLTDKKWGDFLKWLKDAHHLSKMYTPDRYSVKLWQEYMGERRAK